MSNKLNLSDLLNGESDVLKRIHNEIDGERIGPVASHGSHSSGHSSSGGHYSSIARVEALEPKAE
jgi:hypothetical protein